LEDLDLIATSTRRVGALALAATMFVAACGSSSATTAPSSAAASAAPPSMAAPSTAASMAASAAPSTAASAGTGAVSCATGSITAAGSTALQPLVDAAGKQYAAACSGATISVQGGGSGTGLTQVLGGAIQIGNSDVEAGSKLQAADAGQLVDHVVARQGWVMVVNPAVTGVTSLTKQQATDIWTGKTTNWKDVGGNDQAIVLIIRPASSGTRATFKKIVLGGATEATGTALTEDSNGAVTTAVSTTPGATSVIGIPYYQANKTKVTALALDGVQGTVENMQNGTYALQGFGHMYTKGAAAGLAASFLDYMMSPAVQNTLIPSLYYAPVK
jgi:phosphate transport system substrate-binding protein